MKVNQISYINYTGRLKPGDIKKFAAKFADGMENTTAKLEAKTENFLNIAEAKIFKDPENLKSVDYAKIAGIDSGLATSTVSSASGITTTYENTWGIYSTIFPSSF